MILTSPVLLFAVLSTLTQQVPSVTAAPADAPPVIDGRLEEEVWGGGQSVRRGTDSLR